MPLIGWMKRRAESGQGVSHCILENVLGLNSNTEVTASISVQRGAEFCWLAGVVLCCMGAHDSAFIIGSCPEIFWILSIVNIDIHNR